MVTVEGHLYTVGTGEQGQLGRFAECFSSRGGRLGLGEQRTRLRADLRRLYDRCVPRETRLTCGSCDFRSVPDTTDRDRQRQSSVHRHFLRLLRHLRRV